jgi:hypothetical protein|tara:strand:- start:2709 stop:3269 length:561 start_codon:yes stop_codon:yes gene_type:complete
MEDKRLEAHWEAFLRSNGLRTLVVGAGIEVVSNSGVRMGSVLSTIKDRALIEYRMPCGSTSLRIVDRVVTDGPIVDGRSVSYWSVPNKWLSRMKESGVDWIGLPQQSPKALTPCDMLVWKKVRARMGFGHTVVTPSSGDDGLRILFHGPTLSASVKRYTRVLSSCGFQPVERKRNGWQTWRCVGGE